VTIEYYLRNASLLDGTGSPAREMDIAVSGDQIVGVEPAGSPSLRAPVATDIDCGGFTVTPGFVDVHSHDDEALVDHPGMEFKIAQGCTTVVIGNCGFSAAPSVSDPDSITTAKDTSGGSLSEFAARVDQVRPATNAMALVGHNTVRQAVMGDEQNRPPTESELAQMAQLIREAMVDGACGFSTGLVYEPGRYSSTEEVIHLAQVAAPFGGLYASHIRNEADDLLSAVREAIEVGRQAVMPVQISHHKAAGVANWGKVADSLALVDKANANGSDITLDVYPYTAGSGPMHEYFDLNNVDRELAEVTRIATCPAFRHYEGLMLTDIAAAEGRDIAEVLSGIVTAPLGKQTVCIQFHIDEADVETNICHDDMMIGSDGLPELDGKPHPRLFGTFPRFLAHYVRDRGLLDLPEAIRRITSLPSQRFGLVRRGLVAEGHFADLVAFDYERIQDLATYDHPKQEPAGMNLVMVNGQVTYQRGAHTGARGGRMLRYRSPEPLAAGVTKRGQGTLA